MKIERPWSGLGLNVDEKIKSCVSDIFEAWDLSGRVESVEGIAASIQSVSVDELEYEDIIALAESFYDRHGGLSKAVKNYGLRDAIESGAVVRFYELVIDQIYKVGTLLTTGRDGVAL